MSDWLELELAHQLSPVSAPDALWGRVQAIGRPMPQRRLSLRIPALLATAAMLGAWVLWSGLPTARLDAVAARELGSAAPLELQSNDASEIAGWLRREAGIEVSIPLSERVRLEGARVIRQGGTRIGEVAYRVGDNTALLLVAQAGRPFRAPSKHGGLSWQKRHQIYAVACAMPDRPHAACVLCHANL